MQKKLLAVAVAGAMFSPLAMAQSSVTISGVFKVGIDNYKITNPGLARAGLNHNETRITDNSSRIIFGISEDIGGGLYGIGQLDVRPQLDDNATGGNRVAALPGNVTTTSAVAAGNSWVGVRSTTLGTLTLGRHDLHYGKQPDDTAALAGALMAASVSLMDYTAGGVAIAGATRTPNVVRWDSPNWGGFALTAAYSTNAGGNEADLNTGGRKGNAWNFNPSFTSGPFQIGASMWKSKTDMTAAVAAAALTATEQDSLVLYGYYRLGAFKVGFAMNNAEVDGTVAGVNGRVADRTSWTIPASWTAGPHMVAGHYTRAKDDDVTAGQDGAKMMAVSYTYSLSKRTSVGLTYARLDNDAGAAYNFFTNGSSTGGGLGSNNSGLGAGEDGRLMALTVRHAF